MGITTNAASSNVGYAGSIPPKFIYPPLTFSPILKISQSLRSFEMTVMHAYE
jgi:hypothetical protein